MCVKVEVSLDQEESGFFLKPVFRGQEVFSLNSLERPFVVTQPTGPVTVKARYGPFSAEEQISLPLLQSSVGNHSNILSNYVTREIDISAHLVSRTITPERPIVSVLFHANQLPIAEQNNIKSNRNSEEEKKMVCTNACSA